MYSVNPADAPSINAAMVNWRGVIVLDEGCSSVVVVSVGVALVNAMVVFC